MVGTQLGAEMLTAKPWWETWPGHSEEGLVFSFRSQNPTRVPPAHPIAAGPPPPSLPDPPAPLGNDRVAFPQIHHPLKLPLIWARCV